MTIAAKDDDGVAEHCDAYSANASLAAGPGVNSFPFKRCRLYTLFRSAPLEIHICDHAKKLIHYFPFSSYTFPSFVSCIAIYIPNNECLQEKVK